MSQVQVRSDVARWQSSATVQAVWMARHRKSRAGQPERRPVGTVTQYHIEHRELFRPGAGRLL